jgi:hypothetical protein
LCVALARASRGGELLGTRVSVQLRTNHVGFVLDGIFDKFAHCCGHGGSSEAQRLPGKRLKPFPADEVFAVGVFVPRHGRDGSGPELEAHSVRPIHLQRGKIRQKARRKVPLASPSTVARLQSPGCTSIFLSSKPIQIAFLCPRIQLRWRTTLDKGPQPAAGGHRCDLGSERESCWRPNVRQL